MQGNSLTKKILVQKISRAANISQKEASEYLECLITTTKESLESGGTVKFPGLGSFIVIGKDERIGRNPQTGEPITIEARRIVTFKVSTLLKEALNAEKK